MFSVNVGAISVFVLSLALYGCDKVGNVSDVTLDPSYNFSNIAGTMWKTKVPLAIRYQDGVGLYIILSDEFQEAEYQRLQADPQYRNGAWKVIAILPVGSKIRIGRLVQHHGSIGGVRVRGDLPEGPYMGKEIDITGDLFSQNDYLYYGKSYPRAWAVAPDKLEKSP